MTAVSESANPLHRSIAALDAFNFFLADLQTGIGPYLAVFLASVRHFNPAAVGIATAAGGFARWSRVRRRPAIGNGTSVQRCDHRSDERNRRVRSARPLGTRLRQHRRRKSGAWIDRHAARSQCEWPQVVSGGWHVSCRSECMKHHAPSSRAAGLAAAFVAFGGLCAAAVAQPAPPPPPVTGAPATGPGGPAANRPLPPRPVDAIPPGPPGGPAPFGGTVVAARPYHVQIRTRDGRYVNLDLRNGTVIHPLGTTLAPGMRVAVRGVPGRNGAISTDEVDVRLGPPPAPPGRGPGGPRPAAPPPPPGAAPAGSAAPAGPPAPPPPPPLGQPQR